MPNLAELNVKIFADGADRESMLSMNKNPLVQGLTTNPTLMNKAGIGDYRSFALDVLQEINLKPISFEVFSDEFFEMKKQALEIASWGSNVYVKIPITNTRGESSVALVQELVKENVKVNSTAIFTLEQVREISEVLSPVVPSYVSVFAGRIADTGVDPIPLMSDVISELDRLDKCEVIWASPRELLNIFHADSIGCHVITVTNDILKKIHLIGRDLSEYSLETVQMFYDDAVSAGYKL